MRLGLSHDPTATGEQTQEMSLRDGVRPEDRVGSSDILRVRQEGREQTDYASAVSAFVASDQRLLRAAKAEGLEVLDPEIVPAADIPAFLAAL